MSKSKPELVGVQEIAELLDVVHQTAKQWRARGVLPEPEWTVSGVPVWRKATILKWAKETGRLK